MTTDRGRTSAEHHASVMSAETLRERIVSQQEANGPDVELTGCRITGRLNLRRCSLKYALRFVDCIFEEAVDLTHARVEQPIEWVRGQVGHIIADHLDSAASLRLIRVTGLETVSLNAASIDGDLQLTGSKWGNPLRGAFIERHAFIGSKLRVGGNISFNACRVYGVVSLRSAHILGTLDCRHGKFCNPSGYSIDAESLTLGADMLFQGASAHGTIQLGNAKMKNLLGTGASLKSGRRDAESLNSTRLQAEEVYLDRGFLSNGALLFARATISRRFECTGACVKGNRGGALDCDGLDCPEVLLDKGFIATGMVSLIGARIQKELCCTGGQFGNSEGACIAADRLIVRNAVVNSIQAWGSIRFVGAVVEQQLTLTDATLRGAVFPNKGRIALECDGIECRAAFLDRGFNAFGMVSVVGGRITRELNCTNARLSNEDGISLNAERLTVGNVYLNGDNGRQFHATGSINLVGAKIEQQLTLTKAFLEGTRFEEGKVSLRGDGIECNAIFLDRGFETSGEVRLKSAKVTRELNCTGGYFSNAGRNSISGERLICGNVYLNSDGSEKFRSNGCVSFKGAVIDQQLNLNDATFHSRGDQTALDLSGIACGNLLSERVVSVGSVRMWDARISYNVDFTGSRLLTVDESKIPFPESGKEEVIDRDAVLDLSTAACGNLFIRKVECAGSLKLSNASVEYNVDLTGSRLDGQPYALDASGLQVKGRLTWNPLTRPEGEVKLSGAKADRFDNALDMWPDRRYSLNGFAFRVASTIRERDTRASEGEIVSSSDEGDPLDEVRRQVRWLKHSTVCSPGVYQSLASSYRTNGYERAAQEAAVGGERAIRDSPHLGKGSKFWNYFVDGTSRFGYSLHRPLAALVFLIVVGSIIFIQAGHRGIMHSTEVVSGSSQGAEAPNCRQGYPCFQPIVYSLQTLVPVVDLQETQKWTADPSEHLGWLVRAYTWFAIVFGWLVSGALIAGIGKLFRQSSASSLA